MEHREIHCLQPGNEMLRRGTPGYRKVPNPQRRRPCRSLERTPRGNLLVPLAELILPLQALRATPFEKVDRPPPGPEVDGVRWRMNVIEKMILITLTLVAQRA